MPSAGPERRFEIQPNDLVECCRYTSAEARVGDVVMLSTRMPDVFYVVDEVDARRYDGDGKQNGIVKGRSISARDLSDTRNFEMPDAGVAGSACRAYPVQKLTAEAAARLRALLPAIVSARSARDGGEVRAAE